MAKLTRDQVREALAKAGVTTETVTTEHLNYLHDHIDKAMRESDCYDGTMRMNGIKDAMYMTCRTNEWECREAISFNHDGFIGFAGWAGDKNVQPILIGVMRWLKEF